MKPQPEHDWLRAEPEIVRRTLPVAERAHRVQELVRKYVPEGVSLSDELIAERRLEARESSR